MASLKANVIANYLGNGLVALISLAVVPGYLHFLGIEGVGLIAFAGTLQAICSILDFGLATTVTREVARSAGGQDSASDSLRDFLHTSSIMTWAIAVAIPLAVAAASWPFAGFWLTSDRYGPDALRHIAMLMGLAIGARWPVNFYFAILTGVEKQVTTNAVRVTFEIIRGPGTLLCLWAIRPEPEVLFAWQAAVGVAGSFVACVVVRLKAPGIQLRGRASFSALRSRMGFAMGLSGISVTTFVLAQADKVILSKLLPLTEFGYYGLAQSVANGLGQTFQPVMQGFYPRLAALVSAGSREALVRTYHRGAQLMAVIVFPLALVVAAYSKEILLAWTGHAAVAAATAPVASILICGTALNGAMYMPYALQLAYGWTSLALVTNAIAAVIVIPLIVLLANLFGPAGGAAVWLLLNLSYVVVTIPIMHRRILRGQRWAWYLNDFGLPLIAAACVVVATRLLVSPPRSSWETVGLAGTVAALAMLAAALAASEVRHRLIPVPRGT